jgi:hypothetical protein
MNKKRPIPEVVDEQKRSMTEVVDDPQPLVWVYFLSSTTSGMGLFLFIHNLWNRSPFIHPQLLVWVYFYSSTTTGIGLFLFTTTSGIGLFLFIHNLWYRYLFITYIRGCG